MSKERETCFSANPVYLDEKRAVNNMNHDDYDKDQITEDEITIVDIVENNTRYTEKPRSVDWWLMELDWKKFDEENGYDNLWSKCTLGSLKGKCGDFDWIREDATYIGRSVKNDYWQLERSVFANPFTSKLYRSKSLCCQLYEVHIWNSPEILRRLVEIDGKKLMCWCISSSSSSRKTIRKRFCHGQVIVRALNEIRWAMFTVMMRRYKDVAMNEKCVVARGILNETFSHPLKDIIPQLTEAAAVSAALDENDDLRKNVRALLPMSTIFPP